MATIAQQTASYVKGAIHPKSINSFINKPKGEPMSETENAQQQEEEAAPEMVVDYEAECDSLTGRSVLTFQAGHDPQSNEPKLRIVSNTGKGMFCKDWAPVAHIDAILAKAEPVSARTFNDVHPGKSINTGGFLLAIAKDLGVVKVKEESRHHERVPGATVLQALSARIAEANAADKGSKTSRKKAE